METDLGSQQALQTRWWLWAPGREAHFRSVSDAIPSSLSLVKPDGELEIANRHHLDYLGATLEELKGRAAADTVHPDDLPAVVDAWREAIAGGEPYNIESRRRRVDGVYRWFHTYGFPLPDEQGRVVYWYLMERDIDDRIRAEALLAGEKRLLEMVARGRPLTDVLEALCRFVESTTPDCCCSVLLVDPSGAHLQFGAAPSLPPNLIEAVISLPVTPESGACATAVSLNQQVIASDILSETRWVSSGWCSVALQHGMRACWSTPISSQHGKVLGSFAILYRKPGTPTSLHQTLIERFTNIASIAIERARSDAALKRSEAFLAEAQRLSSTGSFSWRLATDEIMWSDEAYRIYGIDPGTPVTFDLIRTRVHPDNLPMLQQVIDRFRREAGELDYETRLLLPHGSIKHLHVVAHGARNQDGEMEVIGTVHDVTQRHLSDEACGRLRSELAHIARATTLGALTASIAHEVNQPLAGIITNASTCLRMLAADPPNIDGASETARRTIRDGRRAADVITRLRAIFGKKEPITEPVDLNEATREVIALTESELNRNGVLVRTQLAEDLPLATGDRVQLQQVILNLLLNASDAMSTVRDRPRQLVISSKRDDADQVCLSVEDTGVGVDPERVDQLFEAFYTTKSAGMGMGLSISRSIIESHHGRLWATPNDGPGATFAFSIPRGPEDVTGVESRGAISTPAVTDAKHIVGSL
jgi:PAS domain S-box-containing protein